MKEMVDVAHVSHSDPSPSSGAVAGTLFWGWDPVGAPVCGAGPGCGLGLVGKGFACVQYMQLDSILMSPFQRGTFDDSLPFCDSNLTKKLKHKDQTTQNNPKNKPY